MARYGIVIDGADSNVQEYDLDTGAFIRDLCLPDTAFDSSLNSNFDSTTGLPLASATTATAVQNPVSLAADDRSVYVLDAQMCRVLRFQPDTGLLHRTFGGKRGLGAGRITPETSKRNSVASANAWVWVTDNAGGYLVRYDSLGNFQAELAISALASAGGVSFDQITGIAWCAPRSLYYLLAQGSANCYLVEMTASYVATGNVIDLTARLSIAGHGGTAGGRIATRGLRIVNGDAYLWTGTKIQRVDLLGASGDQTLLTAAVALAPGWISGDGSQLGYTLFSTGPGQSAARVRTLATGAEIGYAPYNPTASGGSQQVTDPWDMVVTPFNEATGTRFSRDVTARANIRNRATQTVQALARITGRTARSMTARARMLAGTQRQVTARARIQDVATFDDALAEAWQVTDNWGAFSRGFQIAARALGHFQAGNHCRIEAGYQNNRVTLINGRIDEVVQIKTPIETNYDIVGRDLGAEEIGTLRLTQTWQSDPGNGIFPHAHQIVKDACAAMGIGVGALEFPDYPLYNDFDAIGLRILDLVNRLIEPWTLFARVQYLAIVRDRTLSVIRVDWANPPATGASVSLAQQKQHGLTQTLYLGEPRLSEVQRMVIRGATWNVAKYTEATERIEYFRERIPRSIVTGVFGDQQGYVNTEIVTRELIWGDKVLFREESVYVDTVLSKRSTDTYFYVEPGQVSTEFAMPLGGEPPWASGSPDFGFGSSASATSAFYSGAPSANALLAMITSRHEGWVETTVTDSSTANSEGDSSVHVGGEGTALPTTTLPIFREILQGMTSYQYDERHAIACEITASREYDSSSHQWSNTQINLKTHSKTTGAATRTQSSDFEFENSKLVLNQVATQQVGGGRPQLNNVLSRENVVAHQAQTPQGELDDAGNPLDPAKNLYGQALYAWSYENPYLGQRETDTLYTQAQAEQAFQLAGYKWETVPFTAVLNPNILVGEPVRIEVSPGISRSYWVEQVTHTYSHSGEVAITTGRAKRLTLEDVL